MGFLDRLKNMTPFDEMANAGMAAARGIGNVAGQGAYGLGRAAGTGVNLYGQALGRMAGMGMDAAGMGIDAAQGIGNYGLQGAQALGNYGMQGAGMAARGLGAAGSFVGNNAMDNLRRQMDMARTIGSGVGGAAMGAGRGFMEGVRGPEVGMRKPVGTLGVGAMDAIRRRQLQNQQGPMIQVRAPGGVPLR